MARISAYGVLFAVAATFAQVAPPFGAISGRVLDAGSREPIVGATVLIAALDAAPGATPRAPVVTNERGEFSFTGLPTGRYNLSAYKPRYLSLGYGQRPGSGLPGMSVMVTAGQQVRDIAIRLPLASVIAGVITDSRGDAAQGSNVQLFRLEWRNGERGGRSVATDVVDDRGQYRLPGLAPGDYVLSAIATVPTPPTPAPTYFPGTSIPTLALPITLGVSEERAGVNVQLSTAALSTVSGVVTSADGTPAADIKVSAVETTSALRGLTFRSTYSTASGTFRIDNLPPGRYEVIASSENRPASQQFGRWARSDVIADGNPVKDVSLVLRVGEAVSGTIEVEGNTPLSVAPRLTLSPLDRDPSNSASFSARATADGQFTVTGVMPGRYLLVVSELSPGHVVRAALLNGKDVCDVPIEVQQSQAIRGLDVKVSPRAASIVGTLFDSAGSPNADLLVIAFPADEKYWLPGSPRVRTARPASDGKYALRPLPPGAYRVGVVTDAQPGEWFASSFLRKLFPTAVAVSLADGEARSLDVKVK